MRSLHAALCMLLLLPQAARAEYPALGKALEDVSRTAARQVGDRPVHVAVRNVTGLTPPWRVAAAIGSELGSLLLEQNVTATDAAHDERLDFLVRSVDPLKSNEIERAQRFYTEGLLLIGQLRSEGGAPALSLTLYDLADASAIWNETQKLPPSALAIEPNTPPLNRKIAQYATANMGKEVGNRSSWALAAEALKSAGAKRGGIYDFGRSLGPLDALLPGDVLQFEGVKFHENRGKRRSNMLHHTAIVEKVHSPSDLEIIHQAFNGKGVSRYRLDLTELREGLVIAYRPVAGETVLPEALPLRKHTPEPARLGDGRINLLRMIDPQLDCVHGIWHAFDGPLQSVRESYSKLQIPCDLPEAYTLHVRVRREARDDVFGIGLVVGGHQTLLVIDAYGGETTGLHRLDGKRARDNESTRKLRVLPPETWVELECRVTPRSVTLQADGKTVLEWSGDPSRLSMDSSWTVPRRDWLFLASHDNIFAISQLTLSTP